MHKERAPNRHHSERIQPAIARLSTQLRSSNPFLRHQTLIGLSIALACISVILFSAYLYYIGFIPGYVTIIIIAFFSAVLHELEHDTFHNLYFKQSRCCQNIFLAVLWCFKPNTINPWIRKKIHLHHHRHSGTSQDIEERLIGNGKSYGLLRLLIMLDPVFSLTQFKKIKQDSTDFSIREMALSLFPMVILYNLIWMSWLSFHLLPLVHLVIPQCPSEIVLIHNHIALINFLMVVYVVPALIRQGCLVFISSTIHYYKGVSQLTEQVQVIDRWYFLPFQCFCCFFGQTHAIHHVYAAETFYNRHYLRKACYPILKKHGILFNDLGTFYRKNHYPTSKKSDC